MNRRDMIIVAVLMNTGLLAVLFMMAMHTDGGHVMVEQAGVQEVIAQAPPPMQRRPLPPAIKSVPVVQPHTSHHDELDDVINAYATGAPVSKPVLIDEDLLREPLQVTPVVVEAPKQEMPKKETPKYVEVAVKKGDSLDRIARANGTSIKALRRANELASDKLKIGQVLRIPLGDEAPKAEKTLVAAPAPLVPTVGEEFYTIKNGDNPWKIAKMFHVRFEDLLKLNNLDEGKARRLKAGDRIRVR